MTRTTSVISAMSTVLRDYWRVQLHACRSLVDSEAQLRYETNFPFNLSTLICRKLTTLEPLSQLLEIVEEKRGLFVCFIEYDYDNISEHASQNALVSAYLQLQTLLEELTKDK